MSTSTATANIRDMDKSSLVNLLTEKDRRIQELERLLEDQKRLRLQDSNQVEEKAAKIKEWVTNKLKELENQNKQLRDQNRKQKETVESLSKKLASLSPISSPMNGQTNNSNNSNIANLEKVQYIDHGYVPSSPINTIDVNQSLKMRRPQLKKPAQISIQHPQSSISSSSEEDGQSLRITLNPSSRPYHHQQQHQQQQQQNVYYNSNVNRNGGVSLISIGDSNKSPVAPSESPHRRKQQDSPLYDSVNNEIVNRATELKSAGQEDENHYDRFHYQPEDEPPPPPLHQFDRWELELYNLAEETFSSLIQNSKQEIDKQHYNKKHDDTDCNIPSQVGGQDAAQTNLRKSSSSLRNDIISVIKPSYTTIDGNQVVDSCDQTLLEQVESGGSKTDRGYEYQIGGLDSLESNQRNSNDHSSHTSSNHQQTLNQNHDNTNDNPQGSYSYHTQELMKQKSNDSQLFSSPMRTKSGKDSILRTQSVRRQPAPERLYDFIIADLVKRGYLVKHGALRNHSRWFVLKNFHLFCYKRESEETDKAAPTMSLKLEPTFQVQITSQSNDGFPLKITYPGNKSLLLVADSARVRDEWAEILTVAISMSDIESDRLTKNNSQHEGILAMTRHGHIKRCHAVLVKHIVFFLKSPIDPTPFGYVSVKGAKIREVMDNYDYDQEEQGSCERKSGDSSIRDCSLAIYPKFSLNLDPVYLTLGSQQDTDEWFYHLSNASGLDQSSGTEFERILTQSMLDNSIVGRKNSSASLTDSFTRCCQWREQSVMIYSDKPTQQPLTSLPNETLRVEALELSKSILLFTQVPIEPIAIDYHVCLLQNCLTRFLKHPELRNEFFAQLIKQSTYVMHRSGSGGSKLSSISSSGSGSSATQRSSMSSMSPVLGECQFVNDLQMLDVPTGSDNRRQLGNKCESTYSMSHQSLGYRHTRQAEASSPTLTADELPSPPTQSELLQVMQILAIAVSLNLPRGRLRWWLSYHLRRFANPTTDIGKYALFTLKAIDRTTANGCRDNAPSRTEILSILLRNPYDHSTPHSMPVSFTDGSYLVVGADGSTTIEEFMASMSRSINIRPSPQSDFYLFADDPGDAKDLHILEPQRKVLDVVGWWEQTFKQSSIGRRQNTRVIKLTCKKRLLLEVEGGETDQERLFIVNQVNQEIASHKIPLNEALVIELGSIMTQLTFGDYDKSSRDPKAMRRIKEHIMSNFLPHRADDLVEQNYKPALRVVDHWPKLSGRTAQDCIRVYLNCIRRLKLDDRD